MVFTDVFNVKLYNWPDLITQPGLSVNIMIYINSILKLK